MGVYVPIDYAKKLPLQGYAHGLPVLCKEGSVSDGFAKEVVETLLKLPPKLLQMLGHCGYVLILSRKMSDVHPEEKFQKPRGHSQHSKGDDLNGQCCPTERHIHITEFEGLKKANDTAETLRHEIGHAIDHTVGAFIGYGQRDLSLNYEFTEIYMTDVQRMNEQTKQKLKYYIQKCTPAGRSEACAETIAGLLGGGCRDTQYFQSNFPRVVDWVQQKIFLGLNIPKDQYQESKIRELFSED